MYYIIIFHFYISLFIFRSPSDSTACELCFSRYELEDKLRLKIPEMASLYSRMGSPGRQDPNGDQGGGSGGTLFNQIFGQTNLDPWHLGSALWLVKIFRNKRAE
jgi:hypothetical protein